MLYKLSNVVNITRVSWKPKTYPEQQYHMHNIVKKDYVVFLEKKVLNKLNKSCDMETKSENLPNNSEKHSKYQNP